MLSSAPAFLLGYNYFYTTSSNHARFSGQLGGAHPYTEEEVVKTCNMLLMNWAGWLPKTWPNSRII